MRVVFEETRRAHATSFNVALSREMQQLNREWEGRTEAAAQARSDEKGASGSQRQRQWTKAKTLLRMESTIEFGLEAALCDWGYYEGAMDWRERDYGYTNGGVIDRPNQ